MHKCDAEMKQRQDELGESKIENTSLASIFLLDYVFVSAVFLRENEGGS